MASPSPKSLRKQAQKWVDVGISVIPIVRGGSKSPATKTWKGFQDRLPTSEEIKEMFKPGLGIAVLGGAISGNLELLDFDVPKEETNQYFGHCFYDEWLDQLDAELLELVHTMPIVRTPGGGIHLYYRCDDLEGNKKLASVLNPTDIKPRTETIIETRGEGGYCLAPGCPPECHPTGKTYDLISGSFESIPTITGEQRTMLFAMARTFDESGLDAKESKQRSRQVGEYKASLEGTRPGDDFNRRGSWTEILEELGWTLAFTRRDGAELWCRPGKSKRDGISATVRNFEGLELFHSFTSNSDPFPSEESITKFTAYTLIHHNGDYEAAARQLGKEGYGEQGRSWALSAIEAHRDKSVPWASAPESAVNTRVHESDEDVGDAPEYPAFQSNASAPPDSSIFNEVMDPLEVEITLDESKLREREIERAEENKIQARSDMMSRGPGMLVWQDAGDPPKKRFFKKKGKKLIKTRNTKPRDTAWHILRDRFSSPDNVRKIHYKNGEFLLHKDGKYSRMADANVRARVASYLTHFAAFDSKDKETGKAIYKEYEVRKFAVTEMMQTLTDMSVVGDDYLDPCWLCEPEDGVEHPDAREIVACENGLLDIVKRRLLPPSPSFYSFTNTNIVYDPDAPKPNAWLKFLNTALVDEESRMLLQEWFGYCLVQDTRKQKILMTVGKPGSGKGTAVRVLQWLIGKGAYCSMDFEKIGDRFALQSALGKSVMIFPDARQSYGQTKGNVISTLLSISGEDDIFIDRKNVPSVTQKLNTRIMIVSNDVINLSDPSGALNRRMLWIRFPGFSGPEDTDMIAKLEVELSAILNWAVEGYHRVLETGKFTRPASSDYLRESFQEQSSPIKSFIEDMCDVGGERQQPTGEIYKHWNIWRKVAGYKLAQTKSAFGKQLISADMRIKKIRGQKDGVRKQFYSGICLNHEKVQNFIIDSVGEKEWDKAKEEYSRQSDADIIDIFEWADKRGKDT